MDAVKNKKEAEKKIKELEDLEEERKIYA